MKKFKAILISVAMGLIFSIGIMAQPPQPPAGQGTSGDQPPGQTGAPIDPGSGILLMLAAAYGLKKIYNVRQEQPK
jgi:hypothetical protein